MLQLELLVNLTALIQQPPGLEDTMDSEINNESQQSLCDELSLESAISVVLLSLISEIFSSFEQD
jgi:hypothetical protein